MPAICSIMRKRNGIMREMDNVIYYAQGVILKMDDTLHAQHDVIGKWLDVRCSAGSVMVWVDVNGACAVAGFACGYDEMVVCLLVGVVRGNMISLIRVHISCAGLLHHH